MIYSNGHRYLLGIICLVGSTIISFTTAAAPQDNSTSFMTAIKKQGINTDSLSTSKSISRYDTVRLLSSVECIDCLNAPQWMKERYTLQWLRDFTNFPSNNFDDLSHPITTYKSLNYYYCAAYSADQGYVNGYPRASSPYCPGKFCGMANTTMAEFVQIIFNITAKYSTVKYKADWGIIQARALSLIPQDQAHIFDLDDLATIKRSVETCDKNSCATLSQAQLTAYAKYCTYNLDTCGFLPFVGAPAKTWPVAQLNILVQEGIISTDEANSIARVINQLAPGQQMIDIFSKINQKTQCTFDNDYDKDTIINAQDNCPNTPNVSQIDTDKDGIGDVCDCDIDNDNIANGLGIIDDQGHIIANKLIPSAANDINVKNSLYDQCEDIGISKLKGLWIGPDFSKLNTQGRKTNTNTITTDKNTSILTIKGVENSCALPDMSIPFRCEFKGSLDQMTWDFGDGTKVSAGCYPSHTYTKIGTYTITATSHDGAIAKTFITIQANTSTCVNSISSYMTATPLLQKVGKPVQYTIIPVNFIPNDVAQISCNYGDNTTALFTGSTINQAFNQNHIYTKIGRYITQCLITLKDTRTILNTATVTIEDIDNCIFTPNTSQQDINNNLIGDQCENTDLLGLWIKNDANSCIIAPATVRFACTYTGNIGNIGWNFGDGGKGNGCNVSHEFTKAGTFAITATANKGVKASTSIKVIGEQGQQGLSITTTTPVIVPGGIITITPRSIGTIDTIEYISSMGTTTGKPGQSITMTGSKPGTYSITAKAYHNNLLVAAAQIIIAVQTTTQRTSSVILTPASLSIPSNTPITIDTTLGGITNKNITSIKRDFGDGTSITNTNTSLTKIYLTGGPKVITQSITLDDTSTIITMATIVVGGSSDQCIASYMSATPLIQTVGNPVSYTINLLNFGEDQITKIVCDYGDGNMKTFLKNNNGTSSIPSGLKQSYTYLSAGLYTAQCSITLTNGTILPNAATVTITGRDKCRDTSTYKCDMDKDKIPDICDEDIDGDGVNNLLHLITHEQPSCSIDKSNTNLTLEQYEHQEASKGISTDNCPFKINANQADDNRDGYGNVCQTTDTVCVLFDGTSYPGSCPVINPTVPGISTIQVKTCTKCPCQYVQGPVDSVRSLLLDPQKSFIQVTGTVLTIQ